MLRRLLRWSLPALAIATAGALTSACTVTPVAASVGGSDIPTSSLNGELSLMSNAPAGACLLQVELGDTDLTSSDVVGAGGTGTYSMSVVTGLLADEIGNRLVEQYAASKGITLTAAELATAKSDYEEILSGRASTAAQEASTNGSPPACVQADGSPYTGAQLLTGLPSGLVNDWVQNEAFEEKLLARGFILTPKAESQYYSQNPSLFTDDCVTAALASSQTAATQLAGKLTAGASITSQPNSEPLGCATEAEVLQRYGLQSAPVGVPIGPIEDTSSGEWAVLEVTSQLVVPFSKALPLVRTELLQSTDNYNRVNKELVAFSHRTTVSVNPQYGSWSGVDVLGPTPPPPQYLLAAALGTSVASRNASGGIQLNGGG